MNILSSIWLGLQILWERLWKTFLKTFPFIIAFQLIAMGLGFLAGKEVIKGIILQKIVLFMMFLATLIFALIAVIITIHYLIITLSKPKPIFFPIFKRKQKGMVIKVKEKKYPIPLRVLFKESEETARRAMNHTDEIYHHSPEN